jgi:hypothetical protein
MSKEKNSLGFSQMHYEIILDFCKIVDNDPKIPYNEFHRKHSPYSRKKDTAQLLNRAYQNAIMTGPMLWCNKGFEFRLTKDNRKPKEWLKYAESDPNITFAICMSGDWSFLEFRPGASIVQCVEAIIPSSVNGKDINAIKITAKGTLPIDPYPHNWDDIDWKIYDLLSFPRNKKYAEIGRELGVSWDTVKYHFKKILDQCKVLTTFFPLSYYGYNYEFFTFKTDYEIGFMNGLRNLDRTSYLYKFDNILGLFLFIPPKPQETNRTKNRFKELEENGVIDDLRVATPIKYHRPPCYKNPNFDVRNKLTG